MTLVVDTAHSRYKFDTDRRTFTRTPIASNANREPEITFDEESNYTSIYLPGVGEWMVTYLPDGTWIKSTPVVSISDDLTVNSRD